LYLVGSAELLSAVVYFYTHYKHLVIDVKGYNLCISYAVLNLAICKPVQMMYNVDMANNTGANLKTLKNGAIYDMDIKRIVANPNGGTSAITKETSSDMLAKRHARKRATIQAAANEAVERDDWRVTHGDMAFVAAIASTAMMKATTPDDPKAIEAARFLLRESGLSQEGDVESKAGNESALAALGREAIAHLIARARAARVDVVDE
jgi:hypothetical protein